MEVGLREQGILAYDVHRARLTGEAAFDDLGHDAAHAARRPRAPRRLELRERLGSVILVTGEVRWNAAGVAAALDVVLAAEGRDAAAREAHLPRDEREVQERMRVVDAVDVLGDAHAPDQTRARFLGERGSTPLSTPLRTCWPCIPARCLRDVAGGDAGDARRVVERERRQRLAPGVESLGASFDELARREPLVEDQAGHRVEERDVRAGALLDPEVGLVTQLDAFGID